MKWITILLEDPKTNVNLKLNPIEIRGVKILMLDLDKKITGNISYVTSFGKKKIECRRPGMAVSL